MNKLLLQNQLIIMKALASNRWITDNKELQAQIKDVDEKLKDLEPVSKDMGGRRKALIE